MSSVQLSNIVKIRTGLISLLLVVFLASPQVYADSENKWRYGGNLYFWVADLNVETVSGQDVEVDFDTIMDNLDAAFMGGLNARKNRWSWSADLIYLKIGAKERLAAGLPNRPIELNVEADLGQTTVAFTATGGYELSRTDTAQLDFIFGARHLSVDTDLEFDFPSGINRKISDSPTVTDAIIGLRGTKELNDRWYLNYYGDVGSGDADLTWQAALGVNYRFSKVQATAGYRILQWQLDGDGLLNEYEISGPYLGVRFFFN